MILKGEFALLASSELHQLPGVRLYMSKVVVVSCDCDILLLTL